MSRFRKLICGLLSASMCMQSTALGKGRLENFNKTSSGQLNARKRKLKAKLNGKVSSDRFIGSSCAKNEKENFDQLTENLQGHGKVISFEKIGGNVKLFFQDGTVRIVSFSLLSVLPLSVITYLGIKWLYSYLLEYRIRRNLDIFLKNKDRETALQYLNSIRDYLCARKGVDPNCEFTPCKKMNEKYIFSPGDAFAYAEIQRKGISENLIRAIVDGWQDDDLVSNNEKDAKKNVRYMFEYHKLVAPRSLDIAIKRFLGYFFDFFGDKLSKQLWDGIVGNSMSGIFDTFLEKFPDYVGEKFKPSESWFYGWEPYRLMRYNDDIAVYIGNVNIAKEDCECWQKSLWYNSYATFDRFLYGISNLCKGTWISYALMLYYLGEKLFASKDGFLNALGKVETSTFDSKEDFFKAFDEGTGMFASKK